MSIVWTELTKGPKLISFSLIFSLLSRKMQSQRLLPKAYKFIGGKTISQKDLPFSLQFTQFYPQFVDLSLGKPWYQYLCCSESQSRQKSSFCLAAITSK